MRMKEKLAPQTNKTETPIIQKFKKRENVVVS